MGSILPIKPGGRVPVSGPKKAKGAARSYKTAEKVSALQVPVVRPKSALGSRQVALLKDAKNLASLIQKNWDVLPLEDLADQIIELEDKVKVLSKEDSPSVRKIQNLAAHLHFKFVFPIALELEVPESAISISFAKTIQETAQRVLKTASVQPFHELNLRQQHEVIRYAKEAP